MKITWGRWANKMRKKDRKLSSFGYYNRLNLDFQHSLWYEDLNKRPAKNTHTHTLKKLGVSNMFNDERGLHKLFAAVFLCAEFSFPIGVFIQRFFFLQCLHSDRILQVFIFVVFAFQKSGEFEEMQYFVLFFFRMNFFLTLSKQWRTV